jgi:TolB-like protein
LPFHNDSPGEGHDYILNGLMDEILNKLTLVEDLDVVSRTTSEKYRNSARSSREIARELGVCFILEGSAQTVLDSTRIRLQLIEAEQDRHLWAKPYEREIRLENLFDVQEELSLAVASELKIVLKLHEKEGIEKIPTGNLSAYNMYLKASDLLLDSRHLSNDEQRKAVYDAKALLDEAIKLDPSFAEACIALGGIYINQHYDWMERSDVELAYSGLETGHSLIKKALSYDPENREALRLTGLYYQRLGNHSKAEEYFEASFKGRIRTYRDYEWETISFLGYDNFYPGLKSYLQYLSLKPQDSEVPVKILHEVYRGLYGDRFL